jgi:hypothetical protein
MRANKCEHLLEVSLTATKMIGDITKDYHNKPEGKLYDEFGFGANRRKEMYENEFALKDIVAWAQREMRVNAARAAARAAPDSASAASAVLAALDEGPNAAAEAPKAAEAAPPPAAPSSFRPAEDPLMASGWPAMRSSDYWPDARERPVHPGDVSAMGRILDHLMNSSGHIPRSWEGSLARAGRVLEEQCDPDQMKAWTLKNGLYSPHYSTHVNAPESMLPAPKRLRTDSN